MKRDKISGNDFKKTLSEILYNHVLKSWGLLDTEESLEQNKYENTFSLKIRYCKFKHRGEDILTLTNEGKKVMDEYCKLN